MARSEQLIQLWGSSCGASSFLLVSLVPCLLGSVQILFAWLIQEESRGKAVIHFSSCAFTRNLGPSYIVIFPISQQYCCKRTYELPVKEVSLSLIVLTWQPAKGHDNVKVWSVLGIKFQEGHFPLINTQCLFFWGTIHPRAETQHKACVPQTPQTVFCETQRVHRPCTGPQHKSERLSL